MANVRIEDRRLHGDDLVLEIDIIGPTLQVLDVAVALANGLEHMAELEGPYRGIVEERSKDKIRAW